jgi:F-type H+-transporting ATPase subunit b
LENLGINLGFIIVQTINFAIIFIVLKAWVYSPLTNMLDKRRQIVAQGLEDARVASEARANAEREAQRMINEAQVKANDILREADERAEAIKQDIIATAELESFRKRDQGLIEVDQERSRMVSEMRSDVITLAMAAANKLIQTTLTEERQRELLKEFFSGIRDGRVLVLDREKLNGTSADVVSALPLTPNEQSIIKNEVLCQLGNQASVTFRVNRDILGGLVVQVGDQILDGSVAGQLHELRQKLQ